MTTKQHNENGKNDNKNKNDDDDNDSNDDGDVNESVGKLNELLLAGKLLGSDWFKCCFEND
ncbi:MAG: hypothetical protein QWI73_06030, partial [Alphaproteobacteria bacterium]|nr:hypothetical protein [Alphaproteobacteria bacterium]